MMYNLIMGAPCAGKTTYVLTHKKDTDIIIDVDRLYEAISGKDRYDKNKDILKVVLNIRDAFLGSYQIDIFDVWYITTNTQIKYILTIIEYYKMNPIIINPGKKVCKERLLDSRRESILSTIIDRWYNTIDECIDMFKAVGIEYEEVEK